MSRLARWILTTVLLVGALLLAPGCGHQTHRLSHREATLLEQSEKLHPSLESARVPEGAVGAARLHSQFASTTTPRFTLIGGSIHLDYHGATLIENFEEVQKSVYCPYWDAYGHVWTRGFGETDWGGNFGGRCISHAQASANLVAFVESKYQYAVRSLGINLNQCQVNALDSLVWNLGPGVLTSGGALRGAMQRHAWGAILGYDHAGGVVLAGLSRRRHIEYGELVRHCPYGETPAQRAARVRRERVHQLSRDKAQIVSLNVVIHKYHCLNPHGYHGYSTKHVRECLKWRSEHAAVGRDIKHLHKLGV